MNTDDIRSEIFSEQTSQDERAKILGYTFIRDKENVNRGLRAAANALSAARA